MTFLCTPDMADQKRAEVLTFRMTEGVAEIVDALQRRHGARNRSEYLRGLFFLDAHLSGEDTSGLDRPGWITKAFPQFFRPFSAERPIGEVPTYHSGTLSSGVTKEVLDERERIGVELHGPKGQKKKPHRSKAS